MYYELFFNNMIAKLILDIHVVPYSLYCGKWESISKSCSDL